MSGETVRINPNVTQEQRVVLGDVWADSLRHLCDKVSGPTQKRVDESVTFFDRHVRLGVPVTDHTGDHFGILRDDEPGTIGMAVLLDSDRDLHPCFGEYYDLAKFSFSRGVESAIMPDRPLSRLCMGGLLRHEIRHGDNHLRGRNIEPHEYWLGEQQIRQEDNEIIRSLYGRDYVAFVGTAAESLSASMRSSGMLPCDQLSSLTTSTMAEVMDQPANELERTIRASTVVHDLAFAALRHLGLDSAGNLALVTKNLTNYYRARSLCDVAA